MQNNLLRKITTAFIIIVAALAVLQSGFHVLVHFEKVANHTKAEEIISHDLAENWSTMDEQLATINDMIKNKHLYNNDAGRLCERASLIYLQKGDSISYYKYLGYALYFLKDSQDDKTVNIYLDLANFYLNNYAFDYAEEMLKKAESIKPIEDIENLQIKSYAYRMSGIMHFMKYDYNEAETDINTSQKILDTIPDTVYYESYSAMNDVWLARIYEETGRLPKAKEKLDKWDNSYLFELDIYRKICLRDFIIPYYQAKCYYLCAENIKEYSNNVNMDNDAKEQAVIDYLREFMVLCEENNYEKAELYTILKVQREYPTRNEAIQKELNFISNQLYVTLFNQQNLTYAHVINDIVQDSKLELENNYFNRQLTNKRRSLIISACILGIIVIILLFVPILNSRYDSLTGLYNRAVFNHNITRVKKSKVPYGIIMIDIDDFKRVNDTYGHPTGDLVLKRLGMILLKEASPDVKAYRYGGEEFTILVEKNALLQIENIAEHIRYYMEIQAWDFDTNLTITVSLGCATGSEPVDVVKIADDNLYTSKTRGKNQVTM
ncbi:GGDEF domain-containing protein [Pseudobutyrivibrio ruminis]|uniref:GGDEF domain-containing protein n=1 Tax=Pseudobutyrivibrio ruminis TaxID=46206 RepID=UPI00041099D6|nr:GGDEF domain-containing protein [Pseudobutyrivibrio ruminis]